MSCNTNSPPVSVKNRLMFEDDLESSGESSTEHRSESSADNMSLYLMSPGATMLPLALDWEDTSEARERSPLRSNTVSQSPSYSPVSSPTMHAQRMLVKPNERLESARLSPHAVRVPTRRGGGGRARGRGRGVRKGGSDRAAIAVGDDSGWRRGDPVMVCLNNEHLPPGLQEMVDDYTESARRAIAMRGMKRESRRDVRLNADDESEDDIQDADGFVARELFGGDSVALKFEWSPMATFSGRAEEFQPKNPGPTVHVSRPYEAFRFYWNDEILEHIVRETNRYAAKAKSRSARFARDWYDTNVHEIMILFAFWMMLGVIRMPSIKSCFSTSPLLKTGIFRKLMTEPRYWLLNRALHFVDDSTRTPDSSKLFSLGPLVEHLNAKFKEAYILDQRITIDESLTLWKGKLPFKQYIRSKAAHFGIKTFELCESATGYLWSFEIYTGKDTSAGQSRMLKSTEIVTRLMRPLLNKGHQLFLGKWFNSPVLARFLKRNKTDCVGTLRKNRKNVPALIQLVTLKEGTCVARHSGDVVVMAYQDKQPVYTISTCHGAESVQVDSKPGRPSHYRPAIIADYNVAMGGVHKKDQMLEPFMIEYKRNQMWYKKMFKRLLNVSILNSRIILDKSVAKPAMLQVFRLELVDDILNHHLQHTPQPPVRSVLNHKYTGLSPERLVCRQRHFIVRIEFDGPQKVSREHHSSLGRKSCLWCTVVEKRRCRTVYKCETCDVPLCIGCFKNFHTQP